MSCKYLQQFKIPNCKGSTRLLSPSVLEQLVFCHSEYAGCPIYQEREAIAPARKDMQVAVNIQEKLELPATKVS